MYITSSGFLSKLTLNRAMGLTSSFDIFTHDVYNDSVDEKDKELDNSG